MTGTEELLLQTCKSLRFNSGIIAKAKKIKADNHLDFLLKLFTTEVEDRYIKRKNIYQKQAKFDIVKTFENYTFEDIKFPQALTAHDIVEANYVPRHENLIMYGTVGAGKTHLAIAAGVAACDAGFRVRFWRTAALVNALTEAKNQGILSLFMKQFDKIDLLICDEWGYVPIDSDGAKLLFGVISECYERKSVIITTNLEFNRWNEIFADAKITAALLDRIIHHSHLLDFTDRKSWRLKDALLNLEGCGSESI
jgi:DNA replication protein DnaC